MQNLPKVLANTSYFDSTKAFKYSDLSLIIRFYIDSRVFANTNSRYGTSRVVRMIFFIADNTELVLA